MASDVEQGSPDIRVGSLSNPELHAYHMELHSYWREFEDGRGVEGWTKDKLIEKHDEVYAEIEKRELTHEKLPGGLDEASTSPITQFQKEAMLALMEGLKDADTDVKAVNMTPCDCGSLHVSPAEKEVAGISATMDDILDVEDNR